MADDSTAPLSAPAHNARRRISRPQFVQKLTLNSLQAQKVMDRGFSRVSASLFSIDVILRIIADHEQANQVSGVIHKLLDDINQELSDSIERLKTDMDANGIDAVPDYSTPHEYEIAITSPETAYFMRLVKKLDQLMGLIDALWLGAIMDSQKRLDANYQWQQRLVRLSGRIIGMEARARAAAYKQGKGDEVEAEAPSEDAPLDEDIRVVADQVSANDEHEDAAVSEG